MHLQKAHDLKRKSPTYIQLLAEATSLYKESGETLQTQSGPTAINPDDKLKAFATLFEEYLQLYTPLHPTTRGREVKVVTDVISFGLGTTPVSALDGTLVSLLFQIATRLDPPGFFRAKENVLTFSYLRKILKGCQREVLFMHDTQEAFSISEARKNKTLKP